MSLGTAYVFTGMTQQEAVAEFRQLVLPVLAQYDVAHDHNLVWGLPAGPSDIDADGAVAETNVRTLTLPRWEQLDYEGSTEGL